MNDYILLEGRVVDVQGYTNKDGQARYILSFRVMNNNDEFIKVIVDDNSNFVFGSLWQLLITSSKYGLRVKPVCPIAE